MHKRAEYINLNKEHEMLMKAKNNFNKEDADMDNRFVNLFGLDSDERDEYELLYAMQIDPEKYKAAIKALRKINREKLLDFLKKYDKEGYDKEMNKYRKETHSDYLRYTKENDKKAYHDEKNRMEVNRELDFDDLPTWRWAIMMLEDILCYGL